MCETSEVVSKRTNHFDFYCSYSDENSLESIEIKLSRVVFKSGVEDRVGNLGGIAELRRKSTDFASNAQDLLAVEPEIAN